MAEGRNPAAGCAIGCKAPRCGWVPSPANYFPRRDALIDAVGRMDNPCDRPARCPSSCCKPIPKFRLPKEKPECNICCFPEEMREAKIKDYCEQRQKYIERYCPQVTPEMIIESVDCDKYPIAIECPEYRSPENDWILKERHCRTNFLTGWFNPDDNKTQEQVRRERCDPFFKCCGPCELCPYPRGVITYPRQEWVTRAQEERLCSRKDCCGSPYLTEEHANDVRRRQEEVQRERLLRAHVERLGKLKRLGYEDPHPCCPQKFTETPYCLL